MTGLTKLLSTPPSGTTLLNLNIPFKKDIPAEASFETQDVEMVVGAGEDFNTVISAERYSTVAMPSPGGWVLPVFT